MKTRILTLALFAVITVAGLLVLDGCNTRAPQCPLCSRDIHTHMQVSIRHNHLPLKTCCMACALTFKAQEKDVQIEAATDYLNNTSIDPNKATYVVDSDVSPCLQAVDVNKVIREPHSTMYACYDRCSPGILAFSKKEDAEAFRKDHGGTLATFAELEKTLSSRGEHHHD